MAIKKNHLFYETHLSYISLYARSWYKMYFILRLNVQRSWESLLEGNFSPALLLFPPSWTSTTSWQDISVFWKLESWRRFWEAEIGGSRDKATLSHSTLELGSVVRTLKIFQLLISALIMEDRTHQWKWVTKHETKTFIVTHSFAVKHPIPFSVFSRLLFLSFKRQVWISMWP